MREECILFEEVFCFFFDVVAYVLSWVCRLEKLHICSLLLIVLIIMVLKTSIYLF